MNALQLFDHWAEVRRGLLQALDMLTDAQLDFVPGPGLWSLGTVARHIASAEEGWFRYRVTHEAVGFPVYSQADYPTVADIKQLLTEVHARTERFLAGVDAAELERQVPTGDGISDSLRWIIWHVLEHEIHHRGEIYLMLGLLGMEAPDV